MTIEKYCSFFTIEIRVVEKNYYYTINDYNEFCVEEYADTTNNSTVT